MLKADPGRLAREHRVLIEQAVPADDPLWADLPWTFEGPVRLRLELQQALSDVVVRGTVAGTAVLSCRRCLTAVRHELDEEITLFYRSGISEVEAEAEEVYALPEQARELDLGPGLREHVLLAVPQFVICEEGCRGFCPRCGTNLNRASCDCVDEEEDPRWAALRQLKKD